MTKPRYLCIHGHFYQPPRENPWLERVESQESAYPYHDWNERITAECYKPNTAARILDEEQRIVKLVNTYGRMSFNFGPTLLKWLNDDDRPVHTKIVEADRESLERFGGHGSAMAQAYNHMIMPLANGRDRRTQIRWGIRDFEDRFGRKPEGMWLPETATDTATLDLLAEHGIRFTVLAPGQARRVRRLAGGRWGDVSGGRIDPTRAYAANLPSGRSLALFFYDGPISRGVAFEGLLERGETFAQRLMSVFDETRTRPQLAHIATDGETYGHHHRHGEMALAYALDYVERNGLATLTNYGQYLELHPPDHRVEIFDNTSWSCAHGIERWRGDCGCNSGGRPGWNQIWRGPLREALDWLRDETAARYEVAAAPLLADPWEARNAYIDVIMHRNARVVGRFCEEQGTGPLSEEETVRVLKLMELQRHAMLMYTSCGWFFDDISGIETVQVIQYAGRVVQLAQELFGVDLEPGFLGRLERAASNVPEQGNGRRIYEKAVKPAKVGLREVAAHFAVKTLFDPPDGSTRVYCYTVETEDHRDRELGGARLVLGRARVTSVITNESGVMSYGMLLFGGHNVTGGVRPYAGPEAYGTMIEEINTAFERADVPAIIRLQDRHFEGSTYSLHSLFRDEQREAVQRILDGTLADADTVYRSVYDELLPIMGMLEDLDLPAPEELRVAAEVVTTADIRRTLSEADPDFDLVERLLRRAEAWHVSLGRDLPYVANRAMSEFAAALVEQPEDIAAIGRLTRLAEIAPRLDGDIDLTRAQEAVYGILHSPGYGEARRRAGEGAADAREWLGHLHALAGRLALRVEG